MKIFIASLSCTELAELKLLIERSVTLEEFINVNSYKISKRLKDVLEFIDYEVYHNENRRMLLSEITEKKMRKYRNCGLKTIFEFRILYPEIRKS